MHTCYLRHSLHTLCRPTRLAREHRRRHVWSDEIRPTYEHLRPTDDDTTTHAKPSQHAHLYAHTRVRLLCTYYYTHDGGGGASHIINRM